MKKLKNKVDVFLWAFMWMLPVLAYFIAWFRIGAAPEILAFIDDQFSFGFVRDIINDVWQLAFEETLPVAGLISYLVGIEVVHCLFDAVVFIPRIAHTFIDRAIDFAGGDK